VHWPHLWLFRGAWSVFPGKDPPSCRDAPGNFCGQRSGGLATYTRDLARAIRDLVLRDARGLSTSPTRGSVPGSISPARFSRNLAATPFRFFPFRPTGARPARRPNYSVLSPASLHAFGIRTRPWQEALQSFLKEKPRIQRRNPIVRLLPRFFVAIVGRSFPVIDLELDPNGTH